MNTLRLVIAVSVTAAGTSILAYYLHRRRRRNTPPRHGWQYAGTLAEIVLYPVKSCAGVQLDEATCMRYGIQSGRVRDRLWILVEEDGQVGFAGRRPRMWKIQPELVGEDEIQITAPSMEPLRLNVSQLIEGRKEVVRRVENMRMPLIECDSQYASWFSRFLIGRQTGLRLFVCLNPVPKRSWFGKNVELSPFMVISDESVSNLNARLTNKVHHSQFRGNFLISTNMPAFAEDHWKWLRIGDDAIFRYQAPCYRCILPNINPFTAERSADCEPLQTLKRFRMRPGQKEPEMGIYFRLHQEGVVKRDDAVYVIT